MKPIFYYLFSALLLAGSAYYHATRYARVAEEVYYPLASSIGNPAYGRDMIDEMENEMKNEIHMRRDTAKYLIQIKQAIDAAIEERKRGVADATFEQGPDPYYPDRPAGRASYKVSKALIKVHNVFIQKMKNIKKDALSQNIVLNTAMDSVYEHLFTEVAYRYHTLSLSDQWLWANIDKNYTKDLQYEIIDRLQRSILQKDAEEKAYYTLIPYLTETPLKNKSSMIFINPSYIIESLKNKQITHKIQGQQLVNQNKKLVFSIPVPNKRLTIPLTTALTDKKDSLRYTIKGEYIFNIQTKPK